VALIGVGDGNSFGHPHAEVVERISTGGAEILRTDRDGDIRIRIHFDGTTEIGTAR
jgi:competence protein ComEC